MKEAKYLAELKLISPLLSNMELVSCLSERGGTSVYVVRSTRSGQCYILKHISVPESQKQVDALLFTGAAATKEDAQKYYEQVVSDYRTELETLESISSSPNLACYRSYQIEPKQDAIGYDVYLLAEQRKTLVDYLSDNAMTHLCAVNLGMDLCNALIDLRAAGLIHRDVKPPNIYLSPQGHFVLGDLGIAKISELKYCSMPEHMLSSYSAPELFDLVGSIEPTTDIYSVGLILYRIYNGNHGPFEDEKTSARAADKRRVTGEALPAPMYADYELTEIILKACAFKPEDRYQTPDEFKTALCEYMKRNQLEDTLIVPPIVADFEPIDPNEEPEPVEPVQFADTDAMSDDFKENFSPDTQMLNAIIDSVHRDMAGEKLPDISNSLEHSDDEDEIPVESPAKRRRKPKNRWIPLAATLAVLLIAAAALVYFFVIAPASIHINSISLVSRSSDSITVEVDSSEEDGSFGVICSDAYGNTIRRSYVSGEQILFDSLVPGTQYTVTVEAEDGKKLTGSYTLAASTLAQTDILSFTATPVSVTQAELNLIIKDGPDPGVWTVRYFADGTEEKTSTFSGHSTTIAGLQSGTTYTFELLEPEGTSLIGQVSTSFSTVPSVDIESIKVALSSSTAILSWPFTGDEPEAWTVTISGTDGYTDTQIVSASTITFEGLTSGETYTVTISAPTMLQPVETSFVPTVTVLESFTADPTEEGGIDLHWICEADPAEDIWIINYGPADLAGSTDWLSTVEVLGSEAPVSILPDDLLPDTTYTATIALKSGEKLEGADATITFATEAAEAFTSYGFKNVYVGLFLCPEQEDWTYLNLTKSRNSFNTDEKIAFAVQTINKLESSTDEVGIDIVLRDADGKLLSRVHTSAVWDEMWNNSLFVGEVSTTPQRAGTYTLQIYFNRQLAAEKEIPIEN